MESNYQGLSGKYGDISNASIELYDKERVETPQLGTAVIEGEDKVRAKLTLP